MPTRAEGASCLYSTRTHGHPKSLSKDLIKGCTPTLGNVPINTSHQPLHTEWKAHHEQLCLVNQSDCSEGMNLLGNSTIKNNTHITPWIPMRLHKSFFELDSVNVWFALSHQEQLLPWQLCPSYTNTCIIVSVTQHGHWAGEDRTTVERTRGHMSSGRTVEPLLRDTSVLRTSRLIRTLGQVPVHYMPYVDVCVCVWQI